MQKLMTLLVLLTAWLLWSGLYKPLLLALGLGSCLLVLYIAGRTGFFRREVYSLHLVPGLMLYWAWLLGELVKSNFAVARIVLSPRLAIQPQVIEVDASGLDPVGQAIFGNSITLTPGTVTLDVSQSRLRVHCLTDAAARELHDGRILRRLTAVKEL